MSVSMRRRQKKRSYGTLIILGLLAITLLVILIPLLRGGELPESLAFLSDYLPGEVLAQEPDEEDNGPAEGKVRVFTSGREIPAYAKVGRDDLFDAARGLWSYMDVSESVVEQGGILLSVRDIVGRVMARKKAPGYAFTEDDFLPIGTRPGVSAGVPAGKRAMRIEVDKVHGIVGLQPGDRFDMMSATSLKAKGSTTQPALDGVFADMIKSQATQSNWPQSRIRVLIQNGVVVSPLETRLIPITNTSLTRGRSTGSVPVQEMVIALDPEEVVGFMEAVSTGADLSCLARSGRPDDPVDSLTPSSVVNPNQGLSSWMPGGTTGSAQPMTVVESISGSERKLVPVPSRVRSEEEN